MEPGMTGGQQPDESLMGQVALGRRDCLAPLVRRYAGPLLTYIRRMVGDEHRSEELFQDVFLAVWTKRTTYEPPRPFRPWLFGIATNQCRASFRRTTAPYSDDSAVSQAESPDPSPPDCASNDETARIVERAVAELPPQQRSVVALRVWNGLSYAEIGQSLELTEATVRSHMHHALAALRETLGVRLKSEI
jgi:RNA polymerase sigma-70 factor (ECF subfamily)